MTTGVSEGSHVRCVYCGGVVVIDSVQEEATEPEGGERFAGYAVTFCEGECRDCNRRVDYDYEPREI